MENLTPKEQALFNFIEHYQSQHGASPTVREMRQHMKLKSDGFIIHCLKSLHEKGIIKKGDTPRSIQLLPSVSEKLRANVVRIPVIGRVPAGGPVISEEHIEDWVSFGEGQIKHPKETFILRVRGDSMNDVGIMDGDYVITSAKDNPKAGDIAVALVDGESTVKRYMLTDSKKPYLKPENTVYKNIYPETDLQIQGVVVGLFRWY